ncbi:MAG: NAD(P)H-hydrate dehydratase [Lachnospiraceae bacterium]|nr:NAD(P)H-hydrate dehydratase [Lachnospiraceae bacterium]
MRVLVTGEEMRQLDGYSIRTMGIPSVVLMERAALTVEEEIRKRFPAGQKVLILSGTGNNGADGLALARMLTLDGDDVQVIVTGNRAHATEEWLTQFAVCDKMKIPATPEIPNRAEMRRAGYDIIVDAMLGTGLSRMVSGKISDCMDAVNASGAFVVAVDTPSGISADTGCVLGNAVRADLTVTFEYEKIGLVLFPGARYAGECVVRHIGILPQGLEEAAPGAFTLFAEDLSDLPERPQDSNKGTFGRVLVVAGSRNMAGAAILAAEAAYRAGAGLVRVCTPECNRQIVQTALPEALFTPCAEEFSMEQMAELCRWASAIVVGPGLGTGRQATQSLCYILQYGEVPTVVDADGLNILAAKPELQELLRENCILTPHLGEMSRLTGKPIANIRTDVIGCALDYAEHHGVILVQKDARTVVASPDGKTCYVNTCGNSGMSTGGSGDVLSGILGGLLAGGSEPQRAAVWGVLMHACAGDRAAAARGERAMLAGDILAHL